jgi:hypothetical protein
VSARPVADHAARLAAAVAWLDEEGWRQEADRLAAGAPHPPADAPPTWGEVARAGLAVVEGLAAEDRWAEASAQARYLRRFFAGPGRALSPIAGQIFDGLLAATLARDEQELEDFAELVRELFG